MTQISDAELKQLAVLNGAQHVGTPYVAEWQGPMSSGGINVSPPANGGVEGVSMVLEGGEIATHAFVVVMLRRDASKFQALVAFSGSPVVGESPGIAVNGNLYSYTYTPGDGFDEVAASLKSQIEAAEDVLVTILGTAGAPVLLLEAEGSGGTPSWANPFTLSAFGSAGTAVTTAPDALEAKWDLWGRLPRPDAQVRSMLDASTPAADYPGGDGMPWGRIIGNGDLDGGVTIEQNAIFRIRNAGFERLFVRPTLLKGGAVLGIVPCTLSEA